MKRNHKQLIAAFLLGVLMPLLAMQLGRAMAYSEVTPPGQTMPVPPEQETGPSEQTDRKVPVLLEDDRLCMMVLEEYLLGVVLAEMPASFDDEALKAQAVAARTWTLESTQSGLRHPGGAVCADPKCCQAYIAPEDYLAQGGSLESVDKVGRAVADTQGQVLTYQGALIQATYFSCSGGRTEDAVAVWGENIPYLISVSSPGEEQAEIYSHSVCFSAEEFAACLERNLQGSCKSWLGEVTYTRGGSVATMVVAGKTYTGTELRQLLSLNSAAFQMEADGNTITITTSGRGHRVGMSQYGAEAMAQNGCTYAQILAHYYQGTRIDKVDELG